MSNLKNGIIVSSISGFYYVLCDDVVYECKAKGVFRNKKIKPLTGDFVEIEEFNSSFTITKIQTRKNYFVRPPMANLDKMFIVISTVEPRPNYYVLDKMIAMAEIRNVEPILILTKLDLLKANEILEIYKKAEIRIIEVDYTDTSINCKILDEINDNIVCFVGNSGVGKSTLINFLDKTLNLKTNEISKKLGRGKHTTRTVTIHKLGRGLVADTPGFSSLDIDKNNLILKEDVVSCFREFKKYEGECKYSNCSHTVEKGCKIIEMVENGQISKSRHNSFVEIYKRTQKIKVWEL